MTENADASWEKFLNPDSLKQNLLVGGIYLAAFELFKSSLVGNPKTFFWGGFKDGKELTSPRYTEEVLALDPKHIFNASALWFKKMGVLTDDDVVTATKIREHRNDIAHDIPRYLGSAEKTVHVDLLQSIFNLTTKIDQWWLREVEIPTNPEFDDVELSAEDLENVTSGNMLFLSLMIPIAFGNDSRMRSVYEGWKKHKEGRST